MRVAIFMEVVFLLDLGVEMVVEVVVLGGATVRPDEPSNIPSFFAAMFVLHVPERVCANDDAPEKISAMLVTLDTSHSERSRLNDGAE